VAIKIFISYRRNEGSGYAGHIHDVLQREFGPDSIFIDVDDIPLGSDLTNVLRDQVGKCEVLLALIGPNWLDVRDEEGIRRLEYPNDPVRVEIGTAMQKNIPVIPILFDGAKIPSIDHLPKDLEGLSLRNGIDVRPASFHDDMGRLMRSLKANRVRPVKQSRWGGFVRSEIAMAAIGASIAPLSTVASVLIARILTYPYSSSTAPLVNLSLFYFTVTLSIMYYKF
jgi:hypothetical protein